MRSEEELREASEILRKIVRQPLSERDKINDYGIGLLEGVLYALGEQNEGITETIARWRRANC